MDQTTTIITLPEPRNLNKHHWTNEEKVFKQKERIMQEIQNLEISFRTALLHKLQKSVFGPFLKELNEKQCHSSTLNQNKLQILEWDLKRYTTHDLEIISNRNTLFKDYLNLLKTAVNADDVINLAFLETHLDHLSLNCCFVKEVDSSLKNFQNIQILNLCGNYIREISGCYLPRDLKFLELFDNFINDLRCLVNHAPETIMHLGLGRNRLTNDSNLHLLAKSKNLKQLKSLDLSDNNIYDLKTVLNSFEKMSDLEAFSLEGNPCSVTPDYKTQVLTCFPTLKFLDFAELLEEDYKNVNNQISKELLPQIIFRCYRILGLPEPPKDVKNKQEFYIEVNFPLLIENPMEDIEIKKESIHIPIQNEIKEDNYDTASKKSRESEKSDKSNKKGKDKKDKEKNKKEILEKQKTDRKKGKKSYYTGANEYDKKFEKCNVWCKTERIFWSKIMEFSSIVVNAPDNSLLLIRDTFRSIVPVRLIYLKTAPFSTKPKKAMEKPKKVNSKKADKDIMDTPTELENGTEEEPTETVLKKVTLASFYCDLKSMNWSDDAIDFYWADHSDIGMTALRINGSLKAIEYDVSLDPKKAREKFLKSKDTGEIEGPKIESIPTVLTCQVGFALRRC